MTLVLVCIRGSCKRPNISCRGVGGLTGSRIALALARVPIEDMFSQKHVSWLQDGFHGRLSTASWIDNLYCASDSPMRALRVLKDAENYLSRKWNLSIKHTSKLFMPVLGNDQDHVEDDWSEVTVFPCLGHLLESSGSMRACFRATERAAWRAFWANFGKARNGPLAIATRLNLLERVVKPIFAFRATRWPFVLQHAKTLAKVQRRMIRLIVRIPPLLGEEPAAYSRRAARHVSQLQRERGSWAVGWAKSICTWACHLERNSCNCSWGAKILDVWSSSEVNARRSENYNRPNTRAMPGFTCRRWTDGIQYAIDFITAHCNSVRRARHYGDLRSGGSADLEYALKTVETIAKHAQEIVHKF